MLYIIGFTKTGIELGDKIKNGLNIDSLLFQKTKRETKTGIPVQKSLKEWTKDAFLNADIILYIGACGIAVRSIAPFLADKWRDPAVLVLDEKGNYCISLLSGHAGGGNLWCKKIAEIAGAEPVITTATDVNGKFAVDVFALENQFHIESPSLAKEVSARILWGETIPMAAEGMVFTEKAKKAINQEIKSKLNNIGIRFSFLSEGDSLLKSPLGIYIGVQKRELPFEQTLYLSPQSLVLGIGCKKGTKEETICRRVEDFLEEFGLIGSSLTKAASLDLKKEEQGIQEFCRRRNLPFITYSKEELSLVEGEFSGSSFVKEVTGVDNVCERSALKCAREGSKEAALIVKKQGREGVALAAAVAPKEEIIWESCMC